MNKGHFYFVIVVLSIIATGTPVDAHCGGGHGGGHCCGHFGSSHIGVDSYSHYGSSHSSLVGYLFSNSHNAGFNGHHSGVVFHLLRFHSHSHHQQNYPYFYNYFGYWPLFWLLPYYWCPYCMNLYPYNYSNSAMFSYPYSYSQPITPSIGTTDNQFSNYPPVYNQSPKTSGTVFDGTVNAKEPDTTQAEPF